MQGDNRLGTRGYEGKKPKWDVEDAEFTSQGKAMPFDDIMETTARNYFRSLATYDEKTGIYYFTDPELVKAAKRAVINLSESASIVYFLLSR